MFRRLFRLEARTPAAIEQEMRDELDAHIALGVEHLVARGASPEDALAQMQARLGATHPGPVLVASARRRSRIAERRETFRTVGRDLVFAARQAKRAPFFSLGIVLSLGFGIGASATVYSWMQGFVLRPLPAVRDVGSLASVFPDRNHAFGTSLPEFREWAAQSKTASALTATSFGLFAINPKPAGDNARAVPMYGMFVAANYFDVLGVAARHGRTFTPRDDEPGAEPVAVISDHAWRIQLGGDPAAVGRTLRINNRPARIVGVAPPNFGGNLAAARFDVFVPLATRPYFVPSDADRWNRRDWRWLDVIARLNPGVTIAQADQDFKAIAARQAATFPDNAGRSNRTVPLDVGSANQLEPLFVAFSAITLLVVLLICSNVSNLLLTRAAARERELAVRLSLGAGRARIVAQLMTESLGLALAGAVLGLLMVATMGGNGGLGQLIPAHTSVGIVAQSEMDWRFVAVLIGVTGGCVLTFGLAPALIGSRVPVLEALKNGARGTGESRSRLRTVLVVTQFAFALATLVSSALFFKRDRDVRRMDLGFNPEHVLLVQSEISLAAHDDMSRWGKTLDDMVDRARGIPGVQAAAVASFVPLGIVGFWRNSVRVPGHATSTGPAELTRVNSVGPGYFDVMGIRIVAGRPITDEDRPGRPLAAVVNEGFARKYFGEAPAVGRTFTLDDREHVIVGVAANIRFDYRAIEDAEQPMVYFAWRQTPLPVATLHVRTQGDPMAVSAAVREVINAVDPTLPTLPAISLVDYTAVPFAISRSILEVAGTLSTVALILATMGLFSVISYGVSLRTREIGIRMALGASERSVIFMFLGNAARLIAYGTLAGIMASVVLTVSMRSALPLLPHGTLAEFLGPTVTLAASAFAAGLIPSRRAAAIDPARTLRAE